MIRRQVLLSDLQSLLADLEADLLARAESSEVPEVGEWLRGEYARAKEAERTAESFSQWTSAFATQVAAAWVLSGVFARFLEDNSLVDPPRIAGPGDRLDRARDEHAIFFQDAQRARLSDREYLLDVFQRLGAMPAANEIFGPANLVWALPNWLGPDAAGQLLRFFQKIDATTGELVHDFTDPEWDTRFLGDLYQDLSEAVRKRYALLQTPAFVESFILDRTLEPALEEFGLGRGRGGNHGVTEGTERRAEGQEGDKFRMIDPACGSGHFLLGAFERILGRWLSREPGTNVRELVQRTLDSIHGVDVNPYAIAIARFRLLLAALRACGTKRLEGAPRFHTRLVCGDSLYHGRQRQKMLKGDFSDEAHYFQAENAGELQEVLREGRFHCVVANPPYITPKDKAANTAYRDLYSTCHMKYSLSVPFMQRINELAVPGGFTGQITANSFMKREFGKKLIEQYLPKVDVTHVIDTSGAYIPGHGTPTVILLGRNRKPVAETIRTVMGIRGEPSTPEDPAQGVVWTEIVELVDRPEGAHAKSQSREGRQEPGSSSASPIPREIGSRNIPGRSAAGEPRS